MASAALCDHWLGGKPGPGSWVAMGQAGMNYIPAAAGSGSTKLHCLLGSLQLGRPAQWWPSTSIGTKQTI